jgi:hypothetical protein
VAADVSRKIFLGGANHLQGNVDSKAVAAGADFLGSCRRSGLFRQLPPERAFVRQLPHGGREKRADARWSGPIKERESVRRKELLKK